MVAQTTNHKLPYPSGQDRPCDSWMTWTALGNALDAKMVALNADLDRTTFGRPMAKVSTRVPAFKALGTDVSPYAIFDTVEMDTDGMVNLLSNPYFIAPTRPGLYHATGFARWDSIDIGSQPALYIGYGGGSFEAVSDTYEFAGPNDQGQNLSATIYINGDGNTGVGLGMSSSGAIGDDPRMTHAELTLVWMRDLP